MCFTADTLPASLASSLLVNYLSAYHALLMRPQNYPVRQASGLPCHCVCVCVCAQSAQVWLHGIKLYSDLCVYIITDIIYYPSTQVCVSLTLTHTRTVSSQCLSAPNLKCVNDVTHHINASDWCCCQAWWDGALWCWVKTQGSEWGTVCVCVCVFIYTVALDAKKSASHSVISLTHSFTGFPKTPYCTTH